jgi:hypothetical protein
MNEMKIEVYIEVDLNGFGDFKEFVDQLGFDATLEYGDDVPCYFTFLQGSENIPVKAIPAVLEAALYFTAGNESLVMVSVTSVEKNHQDWLQIAQDYPGAHITEIIRRADNNSKYTVYNLLFPGTPQP